MKNFLSKLKNNWLKLLPGFLGVCLIVLTVIAQIVYVAPSPKAKQRKKTAVIVASDFDLESRAAERLMTNRADKAKEEKEEIQSEETPDVDDATILFCGDSRTLNLESFVDSNAKFIAAESAGYTYLQDQLSNIQNSSADKIVFLFGVNDPGDYARYIKAYNDFATKAKDKKVYVATITPITDENLDVKTYDIEAFNNHLRNGLDKSITLIDLYSEFNNNSFKTSDGLHYTEETAQDICNYIIKMISKNA